MRIAFSFGVWVGLLLGGSALASPSEWDRAIRNNRIDQISQLLARIVIDDVDQPASNGKTALMAAARAGSVPLARHLLAAGADINAENHNGGTALMFAASGGQFMMTSMLLANGARADELASNGWSALTLATVKNKPRIAQLLVDSGADPNQPDVFGWSPLMRAVSDGKTAMIEFLLTLPQVDLNHRNDRGQTVLHLAVIANAGGLIAHLLERGAVQYRDFSGQTPQSIARELDYQGIARYLDGAGVDR